MLKKKVVRIKIIKNNFIRKIFPLFSLFVMTILFKIDSVSADYYCYYRRSGTGEYMTLRLDIGDDEDKITHIEKITFDADDNYKSDNLTSRYTVDFNSCVEKFKVSDNKLTSDLSSSGDEFLMIDKQKITTEDSNGVYDNSGKNTIDFFEQNYVSCGGVGDSALVKLIPSIIPKISTSVYNAILVVVPIIMVLLGMIDLVKGIISQKEDEMRKGRSSLVKRTIMGVTTFLIVLLVKMLINLVSGGSSAVRIVSCIDCFINNDCTHPPTDINSIPDPHNSNQTISEQ